MVRGEIDIKAEPGSVTVRYDITSKSPHGRFKVGLGYLALAVVVLSFLVFAPGKQRALSAWDDMHSHPVTSSGFLVPFCFVLLGSGVLAWAVIRGVLIAHPGDQKLEFDGQMLTVSRMRWLDWENKDWIAESYLLKDVSRMRYGVILSGKGNSIDGLRFSAAGRSYKLFPKLTTNQAGKILGGLEALGLETDRQQKRIKAASARRRSAGRR
jgi:hypothetical protein